MLRYALLMILFCSVMACQSYAIKFQSPESRPECQNDKTQQECEVYKFETGVNLSVWTCKMMVTTSIRDSKKLLTSQELRDQFNECLIENKDLSPAPSISPYKNVH